MSKTPLLVTEANEIPEEQQSRYTGDNTRASWPFSLHTIRSNMSHCDPARREVMISAFLWCVDEAHPVAIDTFADAIGYAKNTVYKVYSGKYRDVDGALLDIPDKMAAAARTFLDLARERYIGRGIGFVSTPTAAKIWTACDLARESQTPVFLFGRSHVGKTAALERYAHDHNHGHTVYVRMKAACGLGGMVRRIASRCGISANSNTSDLIDRIKNALTPDMLLILDELHLLQYTYRKASFFACVEVIREIFDETRCGLVLSGTLLLLDKLQAGEKAEMEQILKRGVHRFHAAITRHDVAAICKSYGLDMPRKADEVVVQGIVEKPYAMLEQLSKDNGLLAVTERLRYAAKIASRKTEPVTWHHVVAAHLTIQDEAAEEKW